MAKAPKKQPVAAPAVPAEAPPSRPKFTNEMRLALEVKERLAQAGIDTADPDYAELMASETDIESRLRGIIRAARRAEMSAEAMKPIIAANQDRKKRHEARAESMRALVEHCLNDLGLPGLDAPDFTAYFAKSPASVIITDDTIIPAGYYEVITEEKIRKDWIKKALEEQKKVPGAVLKNDGKKFTVRW